MTLRESQSKSQLNCGHIDRQRTVRFSVAASAPVSSFGEGSNIVTNDEYQKSRPPSGSSIDASERGKVTHSTPLTQVGDSHMLSGLGISLHHPFNEKDCVTRTPPERQQGMPQKSGCLAAEPRGTKNRRGNIGQNESSSNRRILEIEGTPSTFRRLAGTHLVPAPSGMQSIPKVANVAYIPRSGMRCGSCPLLPRCSSRSPTKRFALYSTIPGFASEAPHVPIQPQNSSSDASACPLSFLSCTGKGCKVTLDSKSYNMAHASKGSDVSQLVTELQSLREQNATLLRDRSSLLVGLSFLLYVCVASFPGFKLTTRDKLPEYACCGETLGDSLLLSI